MNRLLSQSPAITMVEQQLPLEPLDLLAQLGARRLAGQGRLTEVDEAERIPARLREQVVGRPIVRLARRQVAGKPLQRLDHRMSAYLAEPVLGVRKVGLAAVKDAVPVAAGLLIDLLAQ